MKIEPGKGYRLLEKHEILKSTDERATQLGDWERTSWEGSLAGDFRDEIYRRKIDPKSSNLPTLGRIVLFYPPQECVQNGDTKIQCYASLVTQVNSDNTLELATFGPNSLYFQHNVPEHNSDFPATQDHPAGKHTWGWAWPPRV